MIAAAARPGGMWAWGMGLGWRKAAWDWGLGIGQGRGRGRQSGRSTLGGTLALALLLDSGSGSRTGVVGLQWLRASIALRIANGDER